MDNPILKAALDAWTIPRISVGMLLGTAFIYARGFAKLHRQMPARFSHARLLAFMSGIATLMIAIASPMTALDDLLLQVHMIQHLMLMLVAPVLILAGWPAILMLRGLPSGVCKSILGPLLRSRRVRNVFSALTTPIVAWTSFTATTWIWHAPALFQLALRSENFHTLEHACFFATAMMFWWPVIEPWPATRRSPRWTMIPYLILADVQNSMLAALFTFSNRVIYPLYASTPRIGGIAPLDDQVIAGAIMWMPGSLFFLVPATIILFQQLAPQNSSIATTRIAAVNERARPIDSIAS